MARLKFTVDSLFCCGSRMSKSSLSDKQKLGAAAAAIANSDYLLIATGAGFSADSGLPTYSQVADNPVYDDQGIDYSDLCRVECLQNRPSLFYGFWGSCFNAYQEATPHLGYTILKRWCIEKEQQKGGARYYHYTSNVDGYLRHVGFPLDRIHEMHGSIDTWLAMETCSGLDKPLKIDLCPSTRFPVNTKTMELKSDSMTTVLNIEDPKYAYFRPSVLMFDDGFDIHEVMGLQESSHMYQAWEEQMEIQMAESEERLVVLEIGCGIRVPSVRQECQDVIIDTAARCQGSTETRCTHIRINPDDFEIHVPENTKLIDTISIQGKALATLVAIDDELKKLFPNESALDSS